jgi:hypothetical protein
MDLPALSEILDPPLQRLSIRRSNLLAIYSIIYIEVTHWILTYISLFLYFCFVSKFVLF